MTRLEELDLSDCSDLRTLPDTLGFLTQLQRLDVSDCTCLEELPSTLGQLANLRRVTRQNAKLGSQQSRLAQKVVSATF